MVSGLGAELHVEGAERSIGETLALLAYHAVAEALTNASTHGRATAATASISFGADLRLSAREREVLGLMAQGLSNQEIEEALVLTAGAVSKHVSNVFLKLGFRPEDANRRVKAVLMWLRHTER